MSIRALSTELGKKASLELNEDPSRIDSDIQYIKDWIAKQTHLRARTDDQWLVAFLRGCKYSLERTKEKLDLYYSVRTTAPELFRVKHTDTIFNEILDTGVIIILPTPLEPAGPRVAIFRIGLFDPDKYHITDVMSVMNSLHQITLLEDDNSVVAGALSLLDMEGVSMGHFLQMTPMLMKKMTVVSQDASPFRHKGTHYINTPPGFETIFNAMKSLLNEKNKQRLFVHNKNYDKLYEHIPKEILPTEYGGNAGSLHEIIVSWKRKIQQYSDWLQEDLQYGTDETMRPGKPKTSEDMFGLEGSFRQLNFD